MHKFTQYTVESQYSKRKLTICIPAENQEQGSITTPINLPQGF